MNTILKNTISITVITLVAGLALGVVQDITAGPIATQAEKSKEEAYKAVKRDGKAFAIFAAIFIIFLFLFVVCLLSFFQVLICRTGIFQAYPPLLFV